MLAKQALSKAKDMEPVLLIAIAGVAAYLIYRTAKKVDQAVTTATDSIIPGAKTDKIDDSVQALKDKGNNNPFNPEYMLSRKGKSGMLYIPSATKQSYAKKIYSEYAPDIGKQRIFAPGEKVIMDILKSIKTKNQLSDLAYFYNQKYKRDMLTDIQDGLKASGWTNYTYSTKMQPILDFVKSMPA